MVQAPKPDNTPKIIEIDFSQYEPDEAQEVIFKPNAGPQTMFLSANEREVLFGGAAGGEPKSWFPASFRRNASK